MGAGLPFSKKSLGQDGLREVKNTAHVGDLRIVKRQLKYRLRRSDDVPSAGLFRSASAKSWPWAILSTSNKLTENLYNFLQLNIQLRDDPASK